MFNAPRHSYSEHEKIYFYTATINSWKPLLSNDEVKGIVISSLQNLVERNLIQLFAYVIMPNHIHFIWRSIENNGKEKPQGSFLKFTAHEFKKYLRKNNPDLLPEYYVKRDNKKFEFWQRDPLSIEIYSREVLYQKMTYIHNNPVREKWLLSLVPEEYRYSSAFFYLNGKDEFNILTHIGEIW